MTDHYQYIKKQPFPSTWEQLLLLADGDFVSFILLSHAGKTESTALWLAAHSIEKYLKSWLLKNDSSFDPRRFNHRLVDLWEAARERFSDNRIFQASRFDAFIRELNLDNDMVSLRYSYGIHLKNPIFTRTYASVACSLRESILGSEDYRERGPYGILEFSFGFNTHFFEKPSIDTQRIVCDELERLLPS